MIQVTKSPLWIAREKVFRDLDLAFQRCVSFYRALASTMIFEELGIPVINSHEVVYGCEDKLYTSVKLEAAGIPIPRTAIAMSREAALGAAEELGYPLVVKPIYGSWGRMICRALDQESLEEILELRENMQSPHFKIHYLQEYVEKPGRDIRAYYVWGDVPVAIYRVSSRWRTNTALGGRAVKADLTPEQVELVKRAGEVMGGGVLGVDLVEKGDQNLVLELNGIPQYRNVVRVTGYDLSRKIIESTIQHYKR